MRYVMLLIVLIAAFVLGVGQPLHSADAPGDFFNGKNLDNWDGLKEYWSVKDGAIVGTTPRDGLRFNTFLCSKKKYKDFELKFKVKLVGDGANSGVQIRSKIRDGEQDKKNFAVEGPQCDMGQQYWGSLYGEHFGGMMKAADPKLVMKVLKKDDFNDYHIKCVGKHVTIKLNGETTVDDDFPKLPDEGIIAWQLHSGKAMMEVTFKNIEFKDLTGGKENEVSVKGSVRFDGKPLAGAVVTFHPAAGKALPAATTAEDGTYRLQAPPGKYRVSISKLIKRGAKDGDPVQADALQVIPARYSLPEKSTLEVEIRENANNEFVFELTSK